MAPNEPAAVPPAVRPFRSGAASALPAAAPPCRLPATLPAHSMRRFLAGAGFLLALLPGSAATAATAGGGQTGEREVRGLVVDAVSGEPVPGVRVTAGGRSGRTSDDGRFALTVPAETTALAFAAEGYFETSAAVPPAGSEAPVSVRLLPRRISEEVEVTAAAPRAERPSATVVAPREVLQAAGTADNIFRALSTLPGVAATEDFGSRLAVRGGTPDQNLTLMDGVEIHNPYRLFGLVSAFNPETVSSFSLAAGGFGAAYGDRLSSLLVVENRTGRSDLSATSSLSITDGNLVLEGPLPGPGSFLVTGRRTYYDVVVGRVLDQNFPSFLDTQMQARWEFAGGSRLTVLGLRSREDTEFSQEEDDARFDFVSDTSSDLGALRLDAVLGDRLTSTTILSAYRNAEFLDFEGSFEEEEGGPTEEVAFDRELAVTDFSVRQEWALRLGESHLFDAGVELHRLDSGIDQTIRGAERNEDEANPSSVRGGSGLPDFLDSDLTGLRGGVWIQDTFTPGDRLSLEPGVRFDWSTLNGFSTVSPRLALGWDFGGGLRARAAGGLYTQSPGYEKLIQSDYFLDFSRLKEDGLRHERAVHAVAGLEKSFGAGGRFRVEGYYKRFRDLLVGRLETEAEIAERIAAYDFPEALRDSVPSEARITVNPVNGGAGRAYGLDFYLERLDPSARLGGWISYAWGRADRETYGRRYPFEYDRPHAGNLVARFRLSDRFALAGTFRLASGFPFTPAVGARVGAAFDERGRLVPEVDEDGEPFYRADLGGFENLHRGRLPYYSRLDLRLTYRHGGPGGRWSLYAEVINALNRDNAVEMGQAVSVDPDTGVVTVEETPTNGFPRVPTIGIRFRF